MAGRRWPAQALLAAATLLAYANTAGASFHFDDLAVIVANPALRHLEGFWPPVGSRWLGDLTFALNLRLGGLAVQGFHAVNVLVHLGNGLLVYGLARAALQSPALRQAEAGPLLRDHLPLTAGLLFAVHPLATQAVTYLTQRYASLATLLLLASLLLYVRARLALEAGAPGRTAGLALLSLLAGAAAMKTKEIAFTLPAVAALWEWLFFGKQRRVLPLVPLAALALLLLPTGLLTRGQGLPGLLGATGRFASESDVIPRWDYLLTQSRVLVAYLRLLVLPVGQNLDHDIPLSHSLVEPAVLASLALLVAIAALAEVLRRRATAAGRVAGILACFGVAWFFVTSSVESSIIPIRDVMVEHRTYLPSVGVAVALGTALLVGVERLRLRLPPRLQVAGLLALTAGPLAAATVARNATWRDELTLWTDVVAKSPRKARPHRLLGEALLDAGRMDEAVRELSLALELRPYQPDALVDRGMALHALGRRVEALHDFRLAVLLAPGLARARNNLGVALEDGGQPDEARREYLEALRLSPGLPEAAANLERLEAAAARRGAR